MKTTKFDLAIAEFIETSDGNHPFLTTLKFIFADDKPNDNGQGISADEFDSIAASAIGMPIKMKFTGEGVAGHEGSIPIGVIRGMEKKTLEDGTNQLIAEGVLWADEYPEEVAFLKQAHSEGSAPGLSWELGYKSSVLQDGINWLKKAITKAVAFVHEPAYGTRTKLLAVASLEPSDLKASIIALAEEIQNADATAVINNLPDSDFAYIEPGGKKDAEGKTVPRSLRHFPIHDAAHVRNALARLSQSPFGAKARAKVEAKAKKMGIGMPATESELIPDEGGKQMDEELKKLQAQIDELKSQLAEKDKALASLNDQVNAANSEKEVSTKTIAELEDKLSSLTAAAAIEARIRKFTEAGLRLDADAEKASKKRDFIASLSDAQFDEYLADRIEDAKKVPVEPTEPALAARASLQIPRVEVDTDKVGNMKDFLKSISRG